MLKELVTESRSVRSFRQDRIPEETLRELVGVARLCPAAMNLQPLKYHLITEPEECRRLLAITHWAGSLSIKLPPAGHEPVAYIVVCHDTSIAPEKPIFMIDVGIVSQTIMLAARERGLGGCIIGSASEENIGQTLALPAGIVPKLILALGVPDEQIRLVEAKDGEVRYYRDENNVHYVPKRPIEELLV